MANSLLSQGRNVEFNSHVRDHVARPASALGDMLIRDRGSAGPLVDIAKFGKGATLRALLASAYWEFDSPCQHQAVPHTSRERG